MIQQAKFNSDPFIDYDQYGNVYLAGNSKIYLMPSDIDVEFFAEYFKKMNDKLDLIQLWEILVPTLIDRSEVGGLNTKPINLRFHKVWDSKVREISGGLTIMRPAKGQWVENGKVHSERMIPVRIACTKQQILEIAEMTKVYYNQIAVMVYKISEEVHFVR